jgi:hypothetical protein
MTNRGPFDVAQDMLCAFARDIPSFGCGSAALGLGGEIRLAALIAACRSRFFAVKYFFLRAPFGFAQGMLRVFVIKNFYLPAGLSGS